MKEHKLTCISCGKQFIFKMIDGFDMTNSPDYCPRCGDEPEESQWKKLASNILEDAQKAKRDRAQSNRDAAIPPRYANNDVKQFPTLWYQTIQNWEPSEPGQGLGLIGDSGTCKTRMIYQLLSRRPDWNFKVTTSFQLQLAAQEKWQDTKQHARLSEWREAEILFIDDLGKQKFTAAAEAEIFDLIDYRVGQLLPIIFTSNAGSNELAAMLSENMAAPLLRRLRDFCDIINIPST